MKKVAIVGITFFGALGLASIQAKTTTITYGCVFCGGGQLVINDDPVVIDTPTSDCVFCGDGSTSGGRSSASSSGWSKARTKSTYIVDGNGEYAGVATITTGKQSKKGKVDVKIAFKTAAGKKSTASKVSVVPDEDGSLTATWASVKYIGAVTMVMTSSGEVSGTAGIYEFSNEYDNDDGDSGGTFAHGTHTFSVDAADYETPENYDLIDETVPTAVEIVTSNSKSWYCGKAPSIKYKKFKEDGETWYELVGLDDETKTNYSRLKLKYNSKKGTFSGSFKVYATNESSIEKGKPKLKSYSFSVSGRISGGEATGVAVCKKLKASWPITID